ncbi:MAG: hypothetical protein K2O01_09130, partial [Bacteroidales bacterium]|nr:hypothetical protein [Bacteroidales bacterium]
GMTRYEVHEWKNDGWHPSALFKIEETNEQYKRIFTVRSDSIPQGEHRFAFRYYGNDVLKGHYEFDGSIPVVPPIEWPIQTKDISGTIIENGQTKTTEDGHVVIRRDLIRNGTPPYTVSYGTLNAQGMSPSHTTPFPHDTLHISKAGHYYFLISDANVCGDAAKTEIKVLDNLLGVSVQARAPISCHGADDGILQAVPTGTVDERFLDYIWKTDGGTVGREATLGQIRANTAYAVEVRHRFLPRLKTTASMSLKEPAPFSIAVSSTTDVKCHGQHTGSAVFLINGGTPPLAGYWDNFTDGFKIENVPAGHYKLKVFDSRGCLTEYKTYIRQPDTPLRIVVDSLRHVHYNTSNQLQLGYFDAHAEGGTPPLSRVTYNTFGLPQKNKMGGRYPLTAGDANGCTVDTTIVVESYDRLSASIIKTHEVSCFNGYDGACALLIRGGNPPFDIRWSNGSTERGLNDVPAGTYRAVITDLNGCRTTAEVIFNEPAPITADRPRVEQPSYAGYREGLLPAVAADGRITALIKGGTPPYRYAWTHLPTNRISYTEIPVLENCESGGYRLTVFDARECLASFEMAIPFVEPLQAFLNVTADIACGGETTGGLQARATGGTPPYRYTWRALNKSRLKDVPQTIDSIRDVVLANADDTADGLPAGTYELTVTDALNIESTAVLTLAEPERLRPTITDIQAASYGGCTDGVTPAAACDGSVSVLLNGGSGAKRLTWTDDRGDTLRQTETTGSSAGLQAVCGGTYRLFVEDSRGCRDSLDATVPQPAALACSVRQTDSILCHGGREAMAQAVVTGGEPPYSYRFRYEDEETDPLLRTSAERAAQGSDGDIAETRVETEKTETQGGAELVFPMLWKLRAGYYTFYVTDRNGIESHFRFRIPEPDVLQGQLQTSASPCHEPEAGSAVADIRGGTPPYAHRWLYNGLELPARTAELSGLGEGRLEVHVQDRNGCPLVLTGTIDKPEPLTVWATASEESYAGSRYGLPVPPAIDGAIRLDVQGGTPPYRYAWTAEDTTRNSGKDGDPDRDAAEDSRWIPLPDTTATIERLAHGRYGYQVTDSHGCSHNGETEVARTPDLTVRIALRRIISCAGKHDGALQAVVQGGTPPYRYDWRRNGNTVSPQAETMADSLGGGVYLLTVTDAKGVMALDSFHLPAPQPLSAIVHTEAVSGHGAADGHIDWHPLGGRTPLTAVWRYEDERQDENNPEPDIRDWTGSLPDSLRSGTYRLTMTDSSGCRFEQTYTVESPDPLTLSNLHVLHCRGEKVFLEDRFSSEDNGRIRAYLGGGVTPYHIVWRNAAGDTVTSFHATESGDVGISGLPAGIYTLDATDAHGYGLSHSFEVELSTAVQLLLEEATPILCHGDSGVVAVLADGGKAPYHYRWFRIFHTDQENPNVRETQDNHESQDTQAVPETTSGKMREVALPYSSAVSPPLPSGLYRVEIEDTYGVIATDRLFLSEPAPLRLAADLTPWTAERPDTDPDETPASAPAGRLHPNPTGGCPPYRYEWAHGDTADRIAYRRGENYAVTVYDRHACAVRGEFPFDAQAGFEARISCTRAVSCHGLSDGALSVEILGGQPPYRVLWQHGDTGVFIKNLPAALYELSVIDADGHTCAAAFRLTEPAPLTSRILPTMPRCFGRGDGSLTADVSGGSYPYRYHWREGSETAACHGLAVGSYHLTVTDRNGCTIQDSIELKEPEPLRPVLTVRQPLCPDDQGHLHAEAAGGTPPYRFQWHHADYTSAANLIQNARTGYYVLSVSDSLQCRADTNVTLVRAAALQWQPFETRYLCTGQSTTLQPVFTEKAADVVGFWRLPDGSLSSGLETESDQDGLHRLTLVQYGVCRYQDTARVVTIDDTVSSIFWISTQLRVGETVTAADVSYPPSDSSRWTLPAEAELLYAEGPYAEFRFLDTGTFAVTLTSFRGRCTQSKTTLVEIWPANGFKQAAHEPASPFLSLTTAPNPTTDRTQIILDMQIQTDVSYALIEAVSGRIRQRGKWQVPEGRSVRTLELPRQAGLYILMLHTGQATKSTKIIVAGH